MYQTQAQNETNRIFVKPDPFSLHFDLLTESKPHPSSPDSAHSCLYPSLCGTFYTAASPVSKSFPLAASRSLFSAVERSRPLPCRPNGGGC